MKSLLQFVIFTAIFFALWFGLSRISWVDRFHINEFTAKKQEQLSEWMLRLHKMEKTEVTDTAVLNQLERIKYVICQENYIDTADIKLHIFEDEVVNAFAMPGGHIVVNTSLITYCDNPDMLAGVLSHEIAHLQLDHVSRKLAREVGTATLMSMTGGAEHVALLRDLLHTLSSRSFDRDMEREADEMSVLYMQKAKGDPRQLAFFLQKLSSNKEAVPAMLQWISTHPGADERVKSILKSSGNVNDTTPILEPENWQLLTRYVDSIATR